MINYLHDIRNKLTLISGHTSLLAKKYGPEDFTPITTNIMRINDLVNEAYLHLSSQDEKPPIQSVTIKEFLSHLDVLADALKLIFSVEIKNEVLDYRISRPCEVDHNPKHIVQIMENAIGNSINADATVVYIRVLEVDHFCIVELVDNGNSTVKKTQEIKRDSIIPHGLGTKIITKYMSNMNGKAEWSPRFDGNGMVLRLYFPMKFKKS